MLDSVPPAASKTMLGGVAALLLLNFALLSDDAAPGIAALSAVLKPALGFIGSVGFIGCIGLSLKVQSDGPQSRETTVNMLKRRGQLPEDYQMTPEDEVPRGASAKVQLPEVFKGFRFRIPELPKDLKNPFE